MSQRSVGLLPGTLPGTDQLESAALEGWQQELVSRYVALPEGLLHRRTRLLDRLLLHPLLGVLLFLGMVLAVFQLLYAVTTPLQELLGTALDGVQARWLEPGLQALGFADGLKHFLVDGPWLGVSTVATFLP